MRVVFVTGGPILGDDTAELVTFPDGTADEDIEQRFHEWLEDTWAALDSDDEPHGFWAVYDEKQHGDLV